jgi:multifunctional beta-oxidation protein
LAREGVKYNIKSNVIVPVSPSDPTPLDLDVRLTRGQLAASAMTETVMPPDMLKGLKPELIAPFVGVLTAKNVRNCTLML